MDTAQWPEGIGVVKSMEEKKPAAIRPQKPQALNCPRCNSTHTKFCYYNNYSLSQPRYFCKTCRRYWTEGGSLRNVPVGGGSRKNKRSSPSINSSSPASANSSKNSKLPPPDHRHMGVPPSFSQNPSISKIHDHQGQDLNLAYPPTGTGNVSEFLGLPAGNNSPQFSAMEFLKNGIANSRGMMMNSFMSMPMQIPIPVTDSNSMIYSTPSGIGLPFTEFKAGLNFTRDGFESGYSNNNNNNNGNGGGVQESTSTSARLFFPFEDLRAVSTSNDQQQVIDEQNRGHGDHSSGYWNNGGLGGGSW